MFDFVDTHTHLFVKEFDDDREAAVERALHAGVSRLCLPCIDMTSVERIQKMCDSYPGICFPMLGLHPTDVDEDYKEQLKMMSKLLDADNRYIAIGEVGLDFYWDDTRKPEQIDAFKTQIEWALKNELPLVIHSRSAFEELYDVMEGFRNENPKGIFHCFGGTAYEAEKLLSFDGFMLGIGGVLTYKKSTLPQVLADVVPPERIVLETDSPYLPPVPYRGKRNESAYVVEVAKFLSQLYNVTVEEIARITTQNAEKIFPRICKINKVI